MITPALKAPSRGMQYSMLLHGFLLAALLYGLPHIWHPPEEIYSAPHWVDLVSDKDVPKPPSPPAPPQINRTNITHTATVTSTNTDTPPAIIPTRHTVRQPPVHHQDAQPAADPLANILRSVAADASRNPPATPVTHVDAPPATTKPLHAESFNDHLTRNEQDLISGQVRQYWNAPVGAKDADKLIISLHVRLNQDGSLIAVERSGDDARYSSDGFYRAAVDAAIRAVEQASPFKGLLPDRYGTWGDMYYDFRPDAL